nr:cytochrome c oxidase subunit II [Microrhagus sp. ZM-2022]
MATWSQINLQNSVSPLMEQLIFFHDHTMMILLMVTLMVSYLMISICLNNYTNKILLEGQLIEIIWTIMPGIILIFIALPSLHLLYLMDETNSPSITVKSIGHQWYWSYEINDFNNNEFDSYLNTDYLKNSVRLLDVDNRLILPFNTQVRMILTATDVIHSWTLPSAGVKLDATPGRLNQTNLFIKTPGLMFGQCSEICGTNHSFMPITMEMISPKSFIQWIKK